MSEPPSEALGEWRRVCHRSALVPGQVQQVSLGRNALGVPESVLVGVSQSGQLYAYLNLCKHLPIPLDGGSGDFFGHDPDALLCGTHGALYRVSDGFCTRGPCRGTFLRRHVVRQVGDEVWLLVD